MTKLERQAATLFALIADEADTQAERLTRSTSLTRELRMPSVQKLAMCWRIEAEFSIRFTPSEEDRITSYCSTVGDCWNAVEHHLNTQRAMA